MDKKDEANLLNSLIDEPYVLIQEINGRKQLRIMSGNGIHEIDNIIGLLLEAAEQLDADYMQGGDNE